ncbi:hypothetical protein EJ05DRAFT_479388 [Pseudovirgaria hyperparasitica]|uniref:Uncharacterized protein n=1 Tax=Pseudovirgaria hyperparasitica TaxID=470096 RepID=A0A6A6VYL2_9PEZI|nr:uncharacterized protein EJ05DRAFT_479388 [Pseudovirgaria hyperparasitica]KAF2754397.1 hypothetical protein EJ05DRAFT_479388 [Pseudovirgaria hyperparasitica]
MPPKASKPEATKSSTFSEKEMTMLAFSWQCFDEKPKVNNVKLAKLMGYTEGTAKTTWNALQRKLKALAETDETEGNDEGNMGITNNDNDGDDDGAPVPVTPKTTPRKRKTKGEDVKASPTKKSRAKPKTPVKAQSSDDDKDAEAVEAVEAVEADGEENNIND